MADGIEPVTKADLAEGLKLLKDDIVEAIRNTETRLRDEFVERIRDTETKLLRSFYDFAESNQKRLVEIETEGMMLRTRMGKFESRLLEIEKRLNIPPAA